MLTSEINAQNTAPLTGTTTATSIVEVMERGKTLPHILLSDGGIAFGISSIEKHTTATEKDFSVTKYFITQNQVVAELSVKTGSLVEFSSIPEPSQVQLISISGENLFFATKQYGEYDQEIKYVIVTKSAIYAIDPVLSIESIGTDTITQQKLAA